jgi:hypothetical protein
MVSAGWVDEALLHHRGTYISRTIATLVEFQERSMRLLMAMGQTRPGGVNKCFGQDYRLPVVSEL